MHNPNSKNARRHTGMLFYDSLDVDLPRLGIALSSLEAVALGASSSKLPERERAGLHQVDLYSLITYSVAYINI